MLDRDDRVLTFLGRRRQTDSATPKHQKTSPMMSWGELEKCRAGLGAGRRLRRIMAVAGGGEGSFGV